jgi:hypothetical protein
VAFNQEKPHTTPYHSLIYLSTYHYSNPKKSRQDTDRRHIVLQETDDNYTMDVSPLQVLSAPAVLAMEKTLGASGSGLMAELTCTIAGDPRPKVRLYQTKE